MDREKSRVAQESRYCALESVEFNREGLEAFEAWIKKVALIAARN